MHPPATVPTAVLPDHKQLPDKDGTFVHNFHEAPQSNLLTDSLLPRLQELHPDGQFCIGADSGIYFRATQPPLDGCKAPDWFYIPGVPPMLNGEMRRSYVLWQECVRPRLVVEYVSGDGGEEHDTTPLTGKFWVYEQAIAAHFYAIHDVPRGTLELYSLNGSGYQRVAPNAGGRLPLDCLGVELGIWQGLYRGQTLPWLRVWDSTTGELLPTSEERAFAANLRADLEKDRADHAESLLDDTRLLLNEEAERAELERKRANEEAERAELERKRANEVLEEMEKERKRVARLAEKLRALGIDPEAA